MNPCKLLYPLLFIIVLPCSADTIVTATSPIGQDYYGKIDDVQPDESALIINDTRLTYTASSQLLRQRGQRITNLTRELTLGTPIKYHLSKGATFPTLKDLQIISIYDYEKSQETEQDD